MIAVAAQKLVLWQKVLLAAHALEPIPFTLAQLVVAAWELYPEDFSLPGFPEHPDSNKVTTLVIGSRGLVARRQLIKLAPLIYELPPGDDMPKGSEQDLARQRVAGERVRCLLQHLGPTVTCEQIANHLREDGLVISPALVEQIRCAMYPPKGLWMPGREE